MNNLSVITKEFGDISQWMKCPPFWIAKPDMGLPLIEKLKQATARTIGRSAGGRDIIAIEYGEREEINATTDNLHSAIAAKIAPPDPTEIYPETFYGSKRRTKPVVAIQGGIHGSELTGTVATFNLCQIIETGNDLRGKPWPRLAELARNTRIVFIPWLNMDGVERWPVPNTSGAPAELHNRLTHGVLADGTPFKYPENKRCFPIPPDKVAYMGCYFNDAGVNLQYDFTSLHRQPETQAWMECYLRERPDGIVIWHCNAGSMIDTPDYYLPVGHQHTISRIGGAARSRLLREGYEIGRMSWGALPSFGKPFLTQMAATYLVCGGTPVMCELPMGAKEWFFTLDQMLDIGLITLEEILFFAHRDGLRPYELWDKVKKKLASRPE
ncbi:MAG: hypothetical protein HY360_01180 [Verrucomicrobia bacterium]|nr:hypothetical protein [Verrucomicrobiota bacterium]